MSTREWRPDLHPDHSLDLLRPATLKELCARSGVRPDRRAGQNFLINRATLERIVAAVDPRPGDTILEVGAGFGVLTLALAERTVAGVPPLRVRGGEGELRTDRNPSQPPLTLRGGDAGRIIAIERDRHITPILHQHVMRYLHAVEVVEGDVLALWREPKERRTQERRTTDRSDRSPFFSSSVLRSGWKLVANLPYSITSDFLRLLFDAVGTGCLPPPERAVLLLQREVVDRMCADPSRHSEHRHVGMLTILTQLHCSPRRIARVPAAHFWPAPKVESAVVVLEGWRKKEELMELLEGSSRDDFLHLVRTAFGKRRGQLQRTLRSVTRDPSAALRMARIDPTARPEELTLDAWVALARAIKEKT